MKIEQFISGEAVDRLTDILLLVGLDGSILDANAAALECYGYSRTRMLSLNIRDLRASHDQDAVDEQMQKAAQDGLRFEAQHRRSDGTVFPVEVRSARVDLEGEAALFSVVSDVTVRKQTELALRESEELYRSILNASPDGIIITDATGHTIVFSPANLALFGYERRADALGRPLTDFIAPEDRERAVHEAALRFQGGSPRPIELRGLRRDASMFDLEANAEPIWDADGQPLKMVVIVRDITQRKLAERALHVQRDLSVALASIDDEQRALELILDAALKIDGIDSGGIYVADQGGELDLVAHRGVSQEFLERASHYAADEPQARLAHAGRVIYGSHQGLRPDSASTEDHEGLRGLAVIPVTHEGRLMALLNLASRTREEIPMAARDALETLAQQCGIVLMRLRADVALRENQQNLRALFDTVEDLLFVLDGTGHILKTNAMVRNHLGYSEDELVGQDVLMVHPPDRREEAAAIIADMLGGKRDFCPVDVQAKDGTLTPVETRVTPGVWGGKPALFGVSRDVTDRKHAENELRRERALLAQAEPIGRIGSWRVPLAGGQSEWSGQAASILGLDPDSLGTGSLESLLAVVHPSDRDAYQKWAVEASASKSPCRFEFRVTRPDGALRCVCAHGALEASDDGVPIAVAGILHDVSDRKEDEEARVYDLEEAANVDRLTGLHNLRGFDLLNAQVLAQTQRASLGVGLIFCDMDGLKEINDSFGHAQGDRALQDVASILKFTLRSADAIARIGGDEFIVLTVGGDSDSVVHLNERLQEGFDFFNATNERPYHIEVSSGTSWCEPGADCRLEELKSVADRAMYEEKLRRGRGL